MVSKVSLWSSCWLAPRNKKLRIPCRSACKANQLTHGNLSARTRKITIMITESEYCCDLYVTVEVYRDQPWQPLRLLWFSRSALDLGTLFLAPLLWLSRPLLNQSILPFTTHSITSHSSSTSPLVELYSFSGTSFDGEGSRTRLLPTFLVFNFLQEVRAPS